MKTNLLGINKVNAHNRIVIPKSVMERLQICKGDYVAFLLDAGRSVIIRKVDPRNLSVSHSG